VLEQTYNQIATKHVWYSSLGYTEFGVGHFTSNVDIWKKISKIFRSRTLWINIGSPFPKYSDIGQIWINIGSDFPKTVVHVSINCRIFHWKCIIFFLNQVFCKIVCYLAELFHQIVCYLAELFHQIAFPFTLKGSPKSFRKKLPVINSRSSLLPKIIAEINHTTFVS